jgi:hypothetical protein
MSGQGQGPPSMGIYDLRFDVRLERAISVCYRLSVALISADTYVIRYLFIHKGLGS